MNNLAGGEEETAKKPEKIMRDFRLLREKMVKEQIMKRGVRDERVLKAMMNVPRHLFIQNGIAPEAGYDDSALPVGNGQTISQPYMVGIMTQLLAIKSEDKVLEIGTGSGYQTAILAELAKTVITIERIDELSKSAESLIRELGHKNVIFLIGDGTIGNNKYSPYQKILVTAASPDIPPSLFSQLEENGKMVIPVGDRWHQRLHIVEKIGGRMRINPSIDCIFVPLIGKEGWSRENEK